MKTIYLLSGLVLASILLSACGGSDSDSNTMSSSSSMMSSMASSSSTPASSAMSESSASSSMAAMIDVKYSLTLTNLTTGQPLSPLVITLHQPEFLAFHVGMPASMGLEKIAESGDATDYLAAAAADAMVFTSVNADGVTLPGASRTLMLSASVAPDMMDHLSLSLLAMLGNTNDAFTGFNAIALGKLMIGENLALDTLSYDAGTEWNSETMNTVPGPAANGEGFNAVRDDVANQVTMHTGIVTMDDGKSDSALTNMHRWDNPIARVTITRMEP